MWSFFDDLLDLADDQAEFWTGRTIRSPSRAEAPRRHADPNAALRRRVEELERAELKRRLEAAEKAAAEAAAKAREEAEAEEIARLSALRGLEQMIANEAKNGQKGG